MNTDVMVNDGLLVNDAVAADFEAPSNLSVFERTDFNKDEYLIVKEMRFKNPETGHFMYLTKVKSGYAMEISPNVIGTYRWTGFQTEVIDGMIEKGYLKPVENASNEKFQLTIKARNLFDRKKAKKIIDNPLFVGRWTKDRVAQFISTVGYEIEIDSKDKLTLVCKNDELTSRHESHRHTISINGHSVSRLHLAASMIVNRLCKQQIEFVLMKMFPVSSPRPKIVE